MKSEKKGFIEVDDLLQEFEAALVSSQVSHPNTYHNICDLEYDFPHNTISLCIASHVSGTFPPLTVNNRVFYVFSTIFHITIITWTELEKNRGCEKNLPCQ